MRWQDKLNKKEKNHLRENCIRSKKDMVIIIEHQKATGTTCWDCLSIAHKMGINVIEIKPVAHWGER